ncbi:MAG: ComF family protein [Pseudomonadota bacterium]
MPPSLPALCLAILDLALPPGCPACGAAPAPEGVFCPACRQEIRLVGPQACPRCGLPQPAGREPSLCLACRFDPPAQDDLICLGLHQGPLAQALRDFKYRRRLAAGAALGRFLAQGLGSDILRQAQVLAPVPLHFRRLWRRGFNQSLLLARAWTGRLAPGTRPLLLPGLLRRLRHTRPQVGLALQARQDNVAGAFALHPRQAGLIEGQRVLLLDDVYTTGATVGECARVLKEAGAARVTVVTLARAPGRGPGPAEV